MQLKLKAVVAAAALALGGAAVADPIQDFTLGNSALTFLAVDNATTNGTQRASVVIDLGKTFLDFVAGAALTSALDTTVVWNFVANTLTVNGVAQSGTFNWSNPFAFFTSNSNAADVRYAIIGGNNAGAFTTFLTTGAPTATQLTQQTAANTANMATVNSMYFAQNGADDSLPTVVSTFALAGKGGNATTDVSTNANGGVAGNTNFGPALNWQTNLRWNATVSQNTATNLYFLDSDLPDGQQVTRVAGGALNGQFLFNGTTLTWTTAPVPEPGSISLMLAGLGALGFMARRRQSR